MRVVWQLLTVLVISAAGQQGIAAVQGDPWLTLAIGLATAVVALLAYRWVVGLTERRPVTELAGGSAGSGLTRGVLLGAALFGAVIANLWFLEYYQVHGLGSVPGAVGLLGFTAAAVVSEELLFRGVLFRFVERWTGTWISLLVTAAVFGAMHLLNPNATAWGAVAVGIAGGGLLTAAYIAARNLWLPIGVHLGWNLAAGAVFSTEVSGNDTPLGLLDASMSGPAILTGGDFGPEGSPYALLFCLLATAAFLWLARRRANLVPRRRSERDTVATTLRR
ncbi:CPBP family intramembrane glutamic endopeptidase [Pseudonocardia lacus]|uniref:CPBP family intramembrane glutamic endopeptidase n=1 Tax=Pseudonocardia lacus TaxID=2835865 RepID=UPI001BDBDDA7|nr:type II CAAX endopeptidase family protein [Pseudonocardia lacus]